MLPALRPVALLPLLLLATTLFSLAGAFFIAPAARTTASPRAPRTCTMMAAAPAATATQFVVVGKGRVGEALQKMLPVGATVMVGREDSIPAEGTGPIYVATRNDDLAAVIEKTPVGRRKDLVFMQNGWLGSFLEGYGLQDNTQVLVYFAVAKKGEAPTDGKTDVNPEGLTAAHGPWAAELAKTLKGAGLSCHVLDAAAFKAAMFEKLIWISAFMLVGAAHGGCTVGEVEKKYRDEVVGLIRELRAACEAKLGVTFQAGTEERLCAYTRSVAHFPTAVKEFKWRNGFFWELSEKARAEGGADPCPTHSAMLKQLEVV